MNFVFISPNFPKIYSRFVKSLAGRGVRVLGIGDELYDQLNDELKNNLTEYCYVSDLSNLEWMKKAVSYLKDKYGFIDFIESNNEWWLQNDAILREYAGVTTGFLPKEMEKIKYKSQMKGYFQKAGVKTARYILSDTFENAKSFARKVGYPLFAKPDCGVGAMETYKIKDEGDLKNFFVKKLSDTYIIEEFLEGYIVSFDGICGKEGNVVIALQETFPKPIAEIKFRDSDLHYFAQADMPEEFRKMGERVVRSFGISKRCFHIEFFCLTEDKPGLANRGEIIALECNMRSPGGNTPDLLQAALNASYYDIYADVIIDNQTDIDTNNEHFVAISVDRKARYRYIHSFQEIKEKYKDQLFEHGFYSPDIAEAMGEEFFYGKFKTLNEAIDFQKFIDKKRQ